MFIPYDYQRKAIDSIFNYFRSGKKGNPLVVAPTGSGKSVIIAEFCKVVYEKWPTQKILILSHDERILWQDFKVIQKQNANREIGLYSSGLKSKQIKNITIAGINSAYKHSNLFEDFNIIIVDEAHKISSNKKSMYRVFLDFLNKPVIGFTATPFRLVTGYLHTENNAFFDEIVYSITMKTLQKAGKLCQIRCPKTEKILDASQIKMQAGDFIIKELSIAFDRKLITEEIVKELFKYKDLRKKWMLFAIDIEHCEHVSEFLNDYGIKTCIMHSKMKDNDIVLKKFKDGEYQAVVSVAMLTTGLDIPTVDMIVGLRPTASPNLHIQIPGRGSRVAEGKKDCLYLDFAGNLFRNGPIDAPIIRTKGKGDGEAIMKVCGSCNEIVPIATRVCKICSSIFEFKHNLTLKAADLDIISKTNWHKVKDVKYSVYTGVKNIPMLKVEYNCGLRYFHELVCFEHSGFSKRKAHHWWIRRTYDFKLSLIPKNSNQAVEKSSVLKKPIEILVDESGKYDDINEHKFEGEI